MLLPRIYLNDWDQGYVSLLPLKRSYDPLSFQNQLLMKKPDAFQVWATSVLELNQYSSCFSLLNGMNVILFYWYHWLFVFHSRYFVVKRENFLSWRLGMIEISLYFVFGFFVCNDNVFMVFLPPVGKKMGRKSIGWGVSWSLWRLVMKSWTFYIVCPIHVMSFREIVRSWKSLLGMCFLGNIKFSWIVTLSSLYALNDDMETWFRSSYLKQKFYYLSGQQQIFLHWYCCIKL